MILEDLILENNKTQRSCKSVTGLSVLGTCECQNLILAVVGAPLPGRTWPAANYSVIDTGTCDKTLLSSNYNQATKTGNNVIDGNLIWKPNSQSHTNLSLESDAEGKKLKVSSVSSAQRYVILEDLVFASKKNKLH